MKTIFLIAFALALSFFAHSQTIIENPKVGMSTAQNVTLEKIELRDTTTVLWFHFSSASPTGFSIPKKTYIQASGAAEKLFILAAEGVSLNKTITVSAQEEVNYQLFFPKIDPSVSTLDYGEANDGGSWFLYDIQLKPELYKSILPENLSGNWFRSDNAQWEIRLFDSVAIYKSQVWKYKQYSEKNGIGKISLKNGAKTLDLYTKPADDKTCMIGEIPARLVKFTQNPDESLIPADTEPFKLPIFKVDTVTYCGYIKGFNSRFPQKTGMVYVNDVLAGTQLSYLIEIADDGTFQVKFPHSNPQGVFVRLPFSSEPIFIEPGKTIFQLIDKGNKTNPVLFMGDCARINTDLLKIKNINSFDYNQMLEKVLDFSPEQYKVWCQDLQQKDRNALASFKQDHPIGAKAEQVKKLEIDCRYSSTIFEYGWKIEAAWRKKNNIPRDQREIPFKPAKPDSSYYTFLTNDLVNNPLAVLTSDYYFFINRLMYMEALRVNPKSFSISEILTELRKSGYTLTPEEKELGARMSENDSPELKSLQKEFDEKYGKKSSEFNKKYNEKLKVLYKEKSGSVITFAMMEEFLIGQNVEFTDDEKTFLLAAIEFNENPLVKKRSLFYKEFGTAISKFHTEHQELSRKLSQESRMNFRNEKLKNMLGIQPGLATDIMVSQEYCRPIVSEMTPCSAEELKSIQAKISTPFIVGYLEMKNNETKAKIESNKISKGSNVNEVPKTEGDKVFDAIMAKYKGKVVYVDFWATWCAPCRSGIERIKPLKDEMARENVAFVYITNQTSPKATYDNMIPTIKGEHYRVSADEWNILSGRFKISGIPHYVLVGKDGNVINPQLGHLENSQLKTLLMKHIKE